jgi:Fe-Mn family superoxide dismutase
MPWEHNNIQSVVIDTARDPMLATPFNYASMAWNNHFFFKGIVRLPSSLLSSRPLPSHL